jgi:hypothetical protein
VKQAVLGRAAPFDPTTGGKLSSRILGTRSRALVALAATLALALPVVAQAASFGPPAGYPTGGVRPSSVAVGDLNANGSNDLAVANSLSDTVGVLLANGAGGFNAATTYPVGDEPFSVAAGDLNADGMLDLAVANRLSHDVSVLLGGIGGSFTPASAYAAGLQPHSVAIGDVDNDHNLDLIVANRVSDTISLLLGDGTGSFAHATDFPAGDGPHAVALGDLDSDGDLDAAVALFDGDLVSILANDGHGGFAAPSLYTAKNGPQGVALADVNEDGNLDVAAANFFADLASVFAGDGTGAFAPQITYGGGDGPKSIAIGDVDGDGHLDLAIASSESDTVSVLAGDGHGGFGALQSFPAGDQPASIAIAELTGAGLPDIVVADRFGEVVSVLANTGAGPPPTEPPADTTDPVLTVPGNIVVNATGPGGARVTFTATATDDRDQAPAVVCTPPSGSTFAIGTTTVSCTATDAAGNSASTSFTVRVKGAPEQLADMIDKIRAMKGLAPMSASLRGYLETVAACVIAKKKAQACLGITWFAAGIRLAVAYRYLTPAQGSDLTADALRIKAVIGCP